MPQTWLNPEPQVKNPTRVPLFWFPPVLYRHLPFISISPSPSRKAFCEVEVLHAVLTGTELLFWMHLPATPEVIGLAGSRKNWLMAVSSHGARTSCVLFLVLELGSVMHSPLVPCTI